MNNLAYYENYHIDPVKAQKVYLTAANSNSVDFVIDPLVYHDYKDKAFTDLVGTRQADNIYIPANAADLP